jgi:hypothetical protein
MLPNEFIVQQLQKIQGGYKGQNVHGGVALKGGMKTNTVHFDSVDSGFFRENNFTPIQGGSKKKTRKQR